MVPDGRVPSCRHLHLLDCFLFLFDGERRTNILLAAAWFFHGFLSRTVSSGVASVSGDPFEAVRRHAY